MGRVPWAAAEGRKPRAPGLPARPASLQGSAFGLSFTVAPRPGPHLARGLAPVLRWTP